MKTLTTMRALTAIIAATLIATLAGCTATAAPTAAPKPTHSSTAVATPKPTTAPVAAPIVGDLDGNGELDGWESEQLAKATYALPDGSQVAIPTDQPVPAPVIAAVQASVVAVAGKSAPGSAEVMGAQSNAAVAAVAAESAKINRTIVPVFYAYDGSAGKFLWAVGGVAAGTYKASTSEAAAVAAANAWIGSRGSTYIVVSFNQQ